MRVLLVSEKLGQHQALGLRIRIEGITSAIGDFGHETRSLQIRPGANPAAEILKFLPSDFKNFELAIKEFKPELIVIFGLPLAIAMTYRAVHTNTDASLHIDVCDSWTLLSSVQGARFKNKHFWRIAYKLKLFAAKLALRSLPQRASVSFITRQDLVADQNWIRTNRVAVIPNGEPQARAKVERLNHDPNGPFLLLGDGAYAPNQAALNNAINWLELQGCLESVGITVVGPNWQDPSKAGVKVLGWVENLEPIFQSTRASLLLLDAGAGQKNKALDALSFGHPIVGTSSAKAGFENSRLWVDFTGQNLPTITNQLDQVAAAFEPFELETWIKSTSAMLDLATK